MRKLVAVIVAVLSTCGVTSTAQAKQHPKHENAWIKMWADRDESIWPSIKVASHVFNVSEWTLRSIVNGEGGNVNPRTLKSSLCSYSGTGWNTAGSSAFGPFQFMLDFRGACMNGNAWGTFGSYDDAAFRAAKRIGIPVPYRFKHPASNVGQAITAAYMIRYETGISPWCASQC